MEIHDYDTLPSTSATAAEAARAGAGHLYTVVAREQTAGRGRLNRGFFSPRGGLYFTTVLRTGLTPAQYGAVTPFAALAVARAIQRVCGICVQIKWVNDLLLEGKKLCGILAESGTDVNGVPYLLLGIGINIGERSFPKELREIATALPHADKERLLTEILLELDDVQRAVEQGSWLAEYKESSCVLSREVYLYEGDAQRRAFVLDILPNGMLFIRNEQGIEEELCTGEISLRLTQNGKN